jgi:membrane dipeptidase
MFILRLLLLLLAFPAAAQSYGKLHSKAIVVDTHNDVLSSATMNGLSIETDLSGRTHSDIRRMQQGGIDVQVFSIFCDERYGKGTAFAYANREIDSLHAIIRRNPSRTGAGAKCKGPATGCSQKAVRLHDWGRRRPYD